MHSNKMAHIPYTTTYSVHLN